MDNTKITADTGEDNSSTRKKILLAAAELFAGKGYLETSLRELSAAIGIKAGSLYNHFPSKNAILEELLEDYHVNSSRAYMNLDIPSILQKDPTPQGMLNSMQLNFPKGTEDYYLKVLHVILQEQHRNLSVRRIAGEIILRTESNIYEIIETLKKLGFIDQDTDPDFWIKASSSLIYAFSGRMMLGIGDSAPDFTGMGMVEMLRYIFSLLFEKHGVRERNR